jgi:hypothetical protein
MARGADFMAPADCPGLVARRRTVPFSDGSQVTGNPSDSG